MSTRTKNVVEGSVPYPPELVERYTAEGAWGDLTIPQELSAIVGSHANAEAVVTFDGSITYRELDERSDRIAAGLIREGIEIGDRVLLQVDNRSKTVLLWYGLLKAGAIPVCTLTLHREHEIGEIADQTAAVAHAVVADSAGFDLVAFAREIAEKRSYLRLLITVGGDASDAARRLEDLELVVDAETARNEVAARQSLIGPDDVAVFQLSGGTTSVPKVIPRLHAEYWSNALAYATVLGWTADVRVAHPFPLIHNAGITCALHGAHAVGGALVLGNPPEHLDAIIKFGATDTIFMAPTIKQHQASPDWPLVCDVLDRAVLTLGKVPSDAFEDMEGRGVRVVELFGMGEGPFLVTPPQDPAEVRLQTVGRPILPLDDVRILDPVTLEPVPDGDIGELCFAGSSVIRGYYDAMNHNATAFTPEGLLRTGDLAAWREHDGVRGVAIEGRIKEMINRGGEKINAPEVERLLLQHPRIVAAAVVPMPDERLMERACAYLVADGMPLTIPEVQAHLDGLGVAKFKWPERLEHVDELPKTSVGKISKSVMIADIKKKVEEEAVV